MQITINYCPFPYQMAFHQSPARFKIIAGGRRVGKSKSALHDAIAHCLSTNNAVCWWVSPTFAEAREVGFEEFKTHEELKPAIKYINDSQLKVKFINGSTLYFKSADNDKSLRGRGLTKLVMDEAAFVKDPAIWKKVLRPALSDKQGSATLISSPNGRNWFYDDHTSAKWKDNWEQYHWPTHINPMIPQSEIDIAKSELSDIDFRQEYLAEFVSPAGMVYDDFNEENEIKGFQLELHHEIYIGADFGFANPSALLFIAVNRKYGTVTVFDEIYEARLSMQDMLQRIYQKLNKWKIQEVEWIYTDPAGNAEELTSGISPVDFLRMTGGFKVANKGSRISPGLSLVRSYIKSANGTRRFFVTDECPETIRSIRGYCYGFKQGKYVVNEEPEKDGIHDHACDALRYFFVNRFDHAKYVAKELPQQNLLANKQKSSIMKRCTVCRSPFASKTAKTEPPFKCNKCSEELNA